MSPKANLQLCLCRQGGDGPKLSALSTECGVIDAFVTLKKQGSGPSRLKWPYNQQK